MPTHRQTPSAAQVAEHHAQCRVLLAAPTHLQDAERLESAKAAAAAAAGGAAAALPLVLSGGTGAGAALLSLAAAGVASALLGVTYRYAVRQDLGNLQLKVRGKGLLWSRDVDGWGCPTQQLVNAGLVHSCARTCLPVCWLKLPASVVACSRMLPRTPPLARPPRCRRAWWRRLAWCGVWARSAPRWRPAAAAASWWRGWTCPFKPWALLAWPWASACWRRHLRPQLWSWACSAAWSSPLERRAAMRAARAGSEAQRRENVLPQTLQNLRCL